MGKCFFSLSLHASSVFAVAVWMRLHRPNVLGSWTVWFGSHGFHLATLTLMLNAAFQDATHTYTCIETHSNGCFFLSKMVVIRFVPKWWLHKRNLKTSKHVFLSLSFHFLGLIGWWTRKACLYFIILALFSFSFLFSGLEDIDVVYYSGSIPSVQWNVLLKVRIENSFLEYISWRLLKRIPRNLYGRQLGKKDKKIFQLTTTFNEI